MHAATRYRLSTARTPVAHLSQYLLSLKTLLSMETLLLGYSMRCHECARMPGRTNLASTTLSEHIQRGKALWHACLRHPHASILKSQHDSVTSSWYCTFTYSPR